MPNEIIIKIKRRRQKKKSLPPIAQSSPNGILHSRRESDYQARRVSKSGFINFSDTGQIKTGENWTTRNTAFFNHVDIQPYFQDNFTEQAGWTFTQDVPTLAQFNSLSSEILTGEIFGRDIKKSNSNAFPLFILGYTGTLAAPEVQFLYQSTEDLENWTEDGLKLTESERNVKIAFIDLRGYVMGFGTVETNKITTAPTFESEAVTNFRLDAGAKIYFLPNLLELRGDSTTHTDGTHDILTTWGMVWRLKPRFMDEPNAVIETNSGQIEAYQRAIADGGAYRAFTHEFYFASPYIRSNPVTGGAFNTADQHFALNYFNNALVPVGALVGVIKQKGQTYYFWQLPA